MQWEYNGKVYDEVLAHYYGFIYRLTFEDVDGNKFYYIGKKNFYRYAEKPLLKSGEKRNGHIKFVKHRKDHKLVTRELIVQETDWRTYTGSIKTLPDGLSLVHKEILLFARTKRELTYLEAKYQFVWDVLEREEYLNENIMGKFFKGNIV